MDNSVAVLGAGMVGVCCALELQRRGFAVTLLDRQDPGSATSCGNAGVLARSSLVPFNNPSLWAALPRLARNRSVQFRYDPAFVARNLRWAGGFLARARARPFEETATALDALIRLSQPEHRRLLAASGELPRLRDNGWIFLYRSEAAFEAGAAGRAVLARFGVATQPLDAAALAELEPHLKPIFPRALWVRDAASVDNPGAVVQAYARLFAAHGGRILRASARTLRRASSADDWQVQFEDGTDLRAHRVVVALGPWTRAFLRDALALRVPMAFERGYHMHYGAAAGAALRRPVYDTAGGYVLSPMEQGLRLTTGVEWTDLDARSDFTQLDLAESHARAAFPLAQRLDRDAWRGSRPTLPDSRPVVGQAPGHPGLWLAFGHQHIGFSTGPGTAALLGALVCGEPAPVDAAPFRPERFLA